MSIYDTSSPKEAAVTADAEAGVGVKAEGNTEVATAAEVGEAVEMASEGGEMETATEGVEKEGTAADEVVARATPSTPRTPTPSPVSVAHKPCRSHHSRHNSRIRVV